jgi:hypothetical protein
MSVVRPRSPASPENWNNGIRSELQQALREQISLFGCPSSMLLHFIAPRLWRQADAARRQGAQNTRSFAAAAAVFVMVENNK